MSQFFEDSLAKLRKEHDALIRRKNTKTSSNGVWTRYAYPVVTAGHTPLFWRYDLNPATNPRLLERFGINSAFNSGAIKLGGKYILVVRVEGSDRKSFFAVAESDNGVDNFRFWPHPVTIPGETATNVYDMRLTAHEDGWIYGVFCAEPLPETCHRLWLRLEWSVPRTSRHGRDFQTSNPPPSREMLSFILSLWMESMPCTHVLRRASSMREPAGWE